MQTKVKEYSRLLHYGEEYLEWEYVCAYWWIWMIHARLVRNAIKLINPYNEGFIWINAYRHQ